MALPLTGSERVVEVEGELISKPYVEITLNLMRRFGVEVLREGWRSFVVPGKRYSSPGKIRVEGEASSASYFLAADESGGGRGMVVSGWEVLLHVASHLTPDGRVERGSSM